MPPLPLILLDSNVYFRLALSIHPLLKKQIGKNKKTLIVIDELDQEYSKCARLQNKFHWVKKEKYSENRKGCLRLSRSQKKEIQQAFSFMRESSLDSGIGVSRVDLRCVAHGYVLGIPVVTDDIEMKEFAEEYGVSTMDTLSLLKLLLKQKFIDMDKVREVGSYLIYLCDLPSNFKKSYSETFREPPQE